MRVPFRTVSLAVLVGLGPALLAADTIRLKRGGDVQGIVLNESPGHVILEVGTGTMRIPRADIVRIVRSDEAETARLRQAWTDKYYLHPKFVPKGQEDVAESFRKVTAERGRALRAHQTIADAPGREERLRAAIAAVDARLLESSRRLQAASAEEDPEAYNTLVREVNTQGAELTVRRHELEQAGKDRAEAHKTISLYLLAVSEFEPVLAARSAGAGRAGEPADAARFLARLTRETACFEHEFTRAEVPAQRQGSTVTVSVKVNDCAEGTFILDTGASLVTMSEAFAKRLRLGEGQRDKAELILADGRKVQAPTVVLASVQLGDVRSEKVTAVIMPEPPGPDVDGLLGMSFLSRFVLQFDGTTGRLALRQFEPSGAAAPAKE